jgi:aminoglycoside phosphotransferase (APT) family kinase protein
VRGVDAEQQTVYREALAQLFPGSSIVRSESLSGGISSRAMLWVVRLSDGSVRNLVLRTTPQSNPELRLSTMTTQVRVLRLAEEAEIKVPRLWGLYPNPNHINAMLRTTPALGDLRPTLLLEYVQGYPHFAQPLSPEMIAALARELAKIHRVTTTTHDLTFLPERWRTIQDVLGGVPAVLDASLAEAQIRRALTGVIPRGRNPSVLLHGDYWPGNVLWRGQELVAVIDWEESEWGDPLADVAVTRLDLLWAFGVDVMLKFTEAYFAETRFVSEDLHWWDLVAALRPMSRLDTWASAYVDPPISRPDITVDAMRVKHQWFASTALQRLGF